MACIAEAVPVEALIELATQISSTAECVHLAAKLGFSPQEIIKLRQSTQPVGTTAQEMLLGWFARTAGTKEGTSSTVQAALCDIYRRDLADIFRKNCEKIDMGKPQQNQTIPETPDADISSQQQHTDSSDEPDGSALSDQQCDKAQRKEAASSETPGPDISSRQQHTDSSDKPDGWAPSGEDPEQDQRQHMHNNATSQETPGSNTSSRQLHTDSSDEPDGSATSLEQQGRSGMLSETAQGNEAPMPEARDAGESNNSQDNRENGNSDCCRECKPCIVL